MYMYTYVYTHIYIHTHMYIYTHAYTSFQYLGAQGEILRSGARCQALDHREPGESRLPRARYSCCGLRPASPQGGLHVCNTYICRDICVYRYIHTCFLHTRICICVCMLMYFVVIYIYIHIHIHIVCSFFVIDVCIYTYTNCTCNMYT